jgi:hypothetical protein
MSVISIFGTQDEVRVKVMMSKALTIEDVRLYLDVNKV